MMKIPIVERILQAVKIPNNVSTCFIKMHVREVTQINDVPLMAQTIFRNFAYLEDRPQLNHNLPELFRLLTSETLYGYLLYTQTNDLIGYLIGETQHLVDGRQVFYLSYLYISKKYRKHHLGSKLLEMLKNKIKYIDGLSFIILSCNRHFPPIQKYYRERGFVPDPNIPATKDAIIMTCYL